MAATARITAIITNMTTIIRITAMAEMRRLGPTIGCLAILSAAPAYAEVRCPTEADLETGIRFEHGVEDTALTVRQVPDDLARELKLEADPNKPRYRLLEWSSKENLSVWAVSVRYRGLFETMWMMDFGVFEVAYTRPLESFFPLKIGDRHQVDSTTRVADVGPEGTRPLGHGEVLQQTVTLEVVDQTQISVGNCLFDTLLISKTVSPATPGAPPAIEWEYYAPSLGTWLARLQTRDQLLQFKGMFDSVRVLRPGEADQ